MRKINHRQRTMSMTSKYRNGGSVPAQKILFATLVKAGKTILFEPGGIVVKEDVAAITIHGPNVDKFRGDAGSRPPPPTPIRSSPAVCSSHHKPRG